CSGEIGIDPETGDFAGEDVEWKAKQGLEELKAVVNGAGSSTDTESKCGIYLDDTDNLADVNRIYRGICGEQPAARETVAVKTLPKNCKVEVGCNAIIG